MTNKTDHSEMERIATGVPGLDQILCGGLLPQAVYIFQGGSGEGKTMLANSPHIYEFHIGRDGFHVDSRMSQTEGVMLGHPHRRTQGEDADC
ncbi:ATPase domain-containing protein [Halopseudomonas sp.]|uniref:ATPase domain-containing protein n=1 Tax=Halopseudomonas sp. TaxID=2901191 RepID=UPI0035639630